MRTLLLAILVLMLGASHLAAEDFEGRMDCKVKSNKIIEIIEGRPVEYTHFSDQFVVGDTLHFSYLKEDRNFLFKIEDKVRLKNVLGINFNWHNIESINYTDPDAKLSTAWSKLTLNPDLFYGTGIWNKSMHFTRYYKNDWQGLVTQVTGFMQHQIFTLDCRNNVDKIDEIITSIKGLNK